MSIFTKNEIAYNTIKERIITGKYPCLSEISEDKLQEELGISRTPIREAITQLANEGFIKIYPRKISLVANITYEMINEIYTARMIIEPHLNILASECADKHIWLNEFKNKFENPPSDYSKEELKQYYIDLDMDFHLTILNKSGNSFIINAMTNVYDHNQWARVKSSDPTDKKDPSKFEHLRIIDSILEGDKEKIIKATEIHILNAKDRMFKFFRF